MLANRKSVMLFLASLSVLAGCLWSVSDAHAGRKYVSNVSVWSPTSTTRAATGAIGAARNSSDSNQAIGCWMRSLNGNPATGGCFAYDSSRNYAGCSTNDWDQLELIKHLWDSSYITFFARSDGTCEDITTYNDSYEQPKLP